MTRGLTGRRAFITGATGALGGATARLLADQGTTLALADIAAPDGDSAWSDSAWSGAAWTGALDVTDEGAVAAAIGAAETAMDGIDIVVNAAGIVGPAGPMIDCSLEDWERLFAINVRGTFLVCKHAIPALRRAGGGAVVNIASTAGLAGDDALGPYAASKGAVVQITRCLGLQHAAEGIRVNCVCPGSIASPMLDNCFAMEAALGADRAEIERRYLAGHPIGRFGRPEEVAAAIGFLASDAASYMAGVALPVDGAALA